MKKVYLRTFGCQMNFRDSEFVAGLLLKSGFRLADSIDKSDIILFNSCSVRKHAEDRVFSNINGLKRLKKRKPNIIIGLMGCTAQNLKGDILKILPHLDFSCGPGNEYDIPEVIKDILENRCTIIATDKVNKSKPELPLKYRMDGPRALVSISEGCNNFCSYCIVPYVRGRERSRDAKDIIREVKELAKRGFKEIMLLGQNVNSYRGLAHRKKLNAIRYPLNAKTCDFIQLLERLNKIKGIEKIRFMTSHPKDASPELFRAIGRLEKVDKRLHLPLQSGSDRILKLMNRGYTQKKYLELVRLFKKEVPKGSMTTDIIVGFPSETEKDFNDTLKVIKLAGFEGGFAFKYSPRPPAKAALLKDNIPKDVKEKRHEEALKALKRGIK